MPSNNVDPSLPPPRSAPNLADWLRGRSDAQLARLLSLRPDLSVQPPRSTQVLANRAEQRMSVHRVAGELDTLAMGVLEVLILEQADLAPVPTDRVRTALLEHASAAAVDGALERLREYALIWGADEVSMTPAAREILPWGPGHLVNPPEAGEAGAAQLRAAIAAVDGNQRALLETLARGSGVGRTRDAGPDADPSSPVQILLGAGLLEAVDAENVRLPDAVHAILAGAPLRGEMRLTAPTVAAVKNKLPDVDAAAAGQAMELLRHCAAVLDELGQNPLPSLRTGGVGVRELRKLAKIVGLDEAAAAFLLELLAQAGLIAAGLPDPTPPTDASDSHWAPTDAADHWLAQAPPARWAALATAWLTMARKVWTIGTRDAAEKLVPALSADLASATAEEDRRAILDLLGDAKPGSAIAAPDVLTQLRWRRPRRHGRMPLHLVEHFLREADTIGAIGRGALSTPGRTLLTAAGDKAATEAAAAQAMAAAMPTPIDHVLLQADLTMIAPGPLTPELQARVDQVAEVESAGAATVYRITEQSLRGALDAGNSAAELHELFATASRTPVPQGLTYLIDDVARRHGQLRVGYANAFLRCEDPALLSEVLARLPGLGLRRLAPTVAISHLDLSPLLAELRAAGLAAVGEDESGAIVDLRPRGARVPTPRKPRATVHRPASPNPTAEQLAEVVAGLRAGDQAASARSSDHIRVDGTKARGAATVTLLQTATQVGRAVAIGYVDAKGTAIHRIATPVRFDGGQLEARDTVTGETLRFSLHRITSVALVE